MKTFNLISVLTTTTILSVAAFANAAEPVESFGAIQAVTATASTGTGNVVTAADLKALSTAKPICEVIGGYITGNADCALTVAQKAEIDRQAKADAAAKAKTDAALAAQAVKDQVTASALAKTNAANAAKSLTNAQTALTALANQIKPLQTTATNAQVAMEKAQKAYDDKLCKAGSTVAACKTLQTTLSKAIETNNTAIKSLTDKQNATAAANTKAQADLAAALDADAKAKVAITKAADDTKAAADAKVAADKKVVDDNKAAAAAVALAKLIQDHIDAATKAADAAYAKTAGKKTVEESIGALPGLYSSYTGAKDSTQMRDIIYQTQISAQQAAIDAYNKTLATLEKAKPTGLETTPPSRYLAVVPKPPELASITTQLDAAGNVKLVGNAKAEAAAEKAKQINANDPALDAYDPLRISMEKTVTNSTAGSVSKAQAIKRMENYFNSPLYASDSKKVQEMKVQLAYAQSMFDQYASPTNGTALTNAQNALKYAKEKITNTANSATSDTSVAAFNKAAADAAAAAKAAANPPAPVVVTPIPAPAPDYVMSYQMKTNLRMLSSVSGYKNVENYKTTETKIGVITREAALAQIANELKTTSLDPVYKKALEQLQAIYNSHADTPPVINLDDLFKGTGVAFKYEMSSEDQLMLRKLSGVYGTMRTMSMHTGVIALGSISQQESLKLIGEELKKTNLDPVYRDALLQVKDAVGMYENSGRVGSFKYVNLDSLIEGKGNLVPTAVTFLPMEIVGGHSNSGSTSIPMGAITTTPTESSGSAAAVITTPRYYMLPEGMSKSDLPANLQSNVVSVNVVGGDSSSSSTAAPASTIKQYYMLPEGMSTKDLPASLQPVASTNVVGAIDAAILGNTAGAVDGGGKHYSMMPDNRSSIKPGTESKGNGSVTGTAGSNTGTNGAAPTATGVQKPSGILDIRDLPNTQVTGTVQTIPTVNTNTKQYALAVDSSGNITGFANSASGLSQDLKAKILQSIKDSSTDQSLNTVLSAAGPLIGAIVKVNGKNEISIEYNAGKAVNSATETSESRILIKYTPKGNANTANSSNVEVHILTPQDIYIMPNGKLANGPAALKATQENIYLAAVPREGATAAAIAQSAREFPQRVENAFNSLFIGFTDGDVWVASSDRAGQVQDHKNSVDYILQKVAGLDATTSRQLSKKYMDAINAAPPGEDLANSKRGFNAIRADLEAKANAVASDTARLQTIASANPLHQNYFSIDANGKVINSEDPGLNVFGRISAASGSGLFTIAEINDAVGFLQFTAESTITDKVAQHANALASGSRDAVLQTHRQIAEETAKRSGLVGNNAADFVNSYVNKVQALSDSNLRSTSVTEANLNAAFIEETNRIKANPEALNAQLSAHVNEAFGQVASQKTRLTTLLNEVSASMGHPSVFNTLTFELADIPARMGETGFTGAFMSAEKSTITINTRLLDANMDDATIITHLREEVVHYIDSVSGISGTPQWQDFTESVYNDPAKIAAWDEFNASKSKSGSAFYANSRPDMELLADLVDMNRAKTAELGEAGARNYIKSTFGEQAMAAVDNFNTKLSEMRTSSPTESTVTGSGMTKKAGNGGFLDVGIFFGNGSSTGTTEPTTTKTTAYDPAAPHTGGSFVATKGGYALGIYGAYIAVKDLTEGYQTGNTTKIISGSVNGADAIIGTIAQYTGSNTLKGISGPLGILAGGVNVYNSYNAPGGADIPGMIGGSGQGLIGLASTIEAAGVFGAGSTGAAVVGAAATVGTVAMIAVFSYSIYNSATEGWSLNQQISAIRDDLNNQAQPITGQTSVANNSGGKPNLFAYSHLASLATLNEGVALSNNSALAALGIRNVEDPATIARKLEERRTAISQMTDERGFIEKLFGIDDIDLAKKDLAAAEKEFAEFNTRLNSWKDSNPTVPHFGSIFTLGALGTNSSLTTGGLQTSTNPNGPNTTTGINGNTISNTLGIGSLEPATGGLTYVYKPGPTACLAGVITTELTHLYDYGWYADGTGKVTVKLVKNQLCSGSPLPHDPSADYWTGPGIQTEETVPYDWESETLPPLPTFGGITNVGSNS